MKAGRELDALVAEKVLDWEVRRESWYDEEGVEATVLYDDKGDRLGDSLGWDWPEDLPEELPPFSTDIAAAWQVVEAMQAKGWAVEVAARNTWRSFPEYRWDCALALGAEMPHREMAPTAPLAICLTALAAVGVPNE